MPDLGKQIRKYIDETSEPVTLEDIYDRPVGEARVRTLNRHPAHQRVSTGVLVGLAAAVAAVLLVGVPVLVNRGTSSAPGDDATPTSQSPVTSIVIESAPTTIQQVTVDVAASIVPGLGTLEWTRIEGDETALPQYISDYVDGQYLAYDSAGRWVSDDAVTWTIEDREMGSNGYRWFHEQGEWAVGWVDDTADLLRRDGDNWVRVELPDPAMPAIEGIDWNRSVRIPIESDGVLVFDGTAWGQVPWGDIFGSFVVECGEPEPCVVEPHGMWDWYDETTLRIENPANGAVLAVVTMEVDGQDVRFVDQKTNEVLHTVVGTDDYPADRIADQIRRDHGLVHPGGWVANDASSPEWIDFPWMSHSELVAAPDGGFAAFEFAYDWQNPHDPLVGARVWTSADGAAWMDRGELAFPTAGVEHIQVTTFGDAIQAFAVTGYGDAPWLSETGVTYHSTNALDWVEVENPFPGWFDRTETSFGEVITSMPQSRNLFWISTDGGELWHEVEGPPGSHEPAGAGSGYGGAGAMGDIMYVAFGSEVGSRTLWIGRFDQ